MFFNMDCRWFYTTFLLFYGTFNNQRATVPITDAKLYVPVVTLSVQNNAKLLQQLKTGFKRTINWNKYQSEKTSRVKLLFKIPN